MLGTISSSTRPIFLTNFIEEIVLSLVLNFNYILIIHNNPTIKMNPRRNGGCLPKLTAYEKFEFLLLYK